MTDSLLMRLCTERYDRKTFEQIKSQILTCCLEQQRHQEYSEVQWTVAPKRHKKYKKPRQTINNVYTFILIIEHLRPTRKTCPRNL